MALYTSNYGYIVDSYGINAGSALSAITMLRYLIAGGMAMGTRPLFTVSGFGVPWTMTVLGGVAVVLAPAPFVFWKMGPRLRGRSRFAVSSGPRMGERRGEREGEKGEGESESDRGENGKGKWKRKGKGQGKGKKKGDKGKGKSRREEAASEEVEQVDR